MHSSPRLIATTYSRSFVSCGQTLPTSRAELAIRFGIILRKVLAGGRTWSGASAQPKLIPVWQTYLQQGRSALNFLSQLPLGTPG
jgi:hypothetical protein